MSDITLPRAEAEQIRQALASGKKLFAALAALDAALAEPDAKPEPVAWMESPHGAIRANPLYRITAPQSLAWSIPLYTHLPAALPEPVHPGYIIGAHWLETAYSRIAAGEAEADVLAEVLGERGWAKREPATEKQVAEVFKLSGAVYWGHYRDGWRAAERFHGIRKEDK